MFIKSVILDGFKSYGHRTEILGFDPQFNAITGLNGSGKSNILDSICFLLGITNLSNVRAASLQDLIYKSGQCGITKATVSITFDNRDPEQCPVGFSGVPEITITRQIMMGGKNKYLINGAAAPNKKVQDLFCSVQLNVNNPHFLIMQGKVTKVLNMKPPEILAMVEETSGTRMYEVKKQAAEKTIQKKEARLIELQTVIDEELTPRLEKCRAERSKYLELRSVEKILQDDLALFHSFEYVSVQRKFEKTKMAVEEGENEIRELEGNILSNQNEVQNIEEVIETLMKKAQSEGQEEMQKVESELKETEKIQAEVNSSAKSIKEDINNEVKKREQLIQNISEEEKSLQAKQIDLAKVRGMFEKLKNADKEDNEALEAAQKRYDALIAGMEINEEGEAETLLEQLMKARQEATQFNTKVKQAKMRVDFCQKQLNEKTKQRLSISGENLNLQQEVDTTNKQVHALGVQLQKLNFNENGMLEFQNTKKRLDAELKVLRDKTDRFEAWRPQTQFRYSDPEPNFDKRRVLGVVCRLFNVKNSDANYALETAAGGRLFNVVIDTEATGKLLLKKGNLQYRTTFIPMNKISSSKISDKVISIAQNLEGADNVQPALAHVNYDNKLQKVMEFLFGNVLICKDIHVANRLAFDGRIRKKCVTLEGDVVDPAGTLSGGAPPKDGSILTLLSDIQRCEAQLHTMEHERNDCQNKITKMLSKQNEYMALKEKLDMKQHELNLLNTRLQQTSDFRHKQEIENLKSEITTLTAQIKDYQEKEETYKLRATELEQKVQNSKGGRDDQIKAAEKEKNNLKAKADKSKKEWKQREQEYQIYNGEIEELIKSIENSKQQVEISAETSQQLQQKYAAIVKNSQEITEKVTFLQTSVKQEKSKITEKNKEIQKKIKRKDELLNGITKFEVQIKEANHKLKELKEDYKHFKAKHNDCARKTKDVNLEKVQQMTDAEGHVLEKKIRNAQEKQKSLSRVVNMTIQALLEQQEQEYSDLRKKQKIVLQDKRKLQASIENLDKKKKEVLQKAYQQISKDFGSIFGTLLPGANAKLVPPIGQTCLQGLEIKVALGDVWKESLTELSGGQRSLAALSLILSMLLYKPAPLYILDEVDAALDLSHTQNIGHMLKTHFKTSQFIIVSLKDGMFSNANVLFRTQFVDGVSTVTRTTNRY